MLEHTRAGFTLPPAPFAPVVGGAAALRCRAGVPPRRCSGTPPGVLTSGSCAVVMPAGARLPPREALPRPRRREGGGAAPAGPRRPAGSGSAAVAGEAGSGAARRGAPGLWRCAGRRAPAGRDTARVARPSGPAAGAGGARGRAFTFLLWVSSVTRV